MNNFLQYIKGKKDVQNKKKIKGMRHIFQIPAVCFYLFKY